MAFAHVHVELIAATWIHINKKTYPNRETLAPFLDSALEYDFSRRVTYFINFYTNERSTTRRKKILTFSNATSQQYDVT